MARKRTFTEEQRRQVGEQTRRLWQDPEYRTKMSEVAKKITPARQKHLARLHADPVLKEKRSEVARLNNIKRRGFDVPPEKADDYKIIRRKLRNSREAGRILGLIE